MKIKFSPSSYYFLNIFTFKSTFALILDVVFFEREVQSVESKSHGRKHTRNVYCKLCVNTNME